MLIGLTPASAPGTLVRQELMYHALLSRVQTHSRTQTPAQPTRTDVDKTAPLRQPTSQTSRLSLRISTRAFYTGRAGCFCSVAMFITSHLVTFSSLGASMPLWSRDPRVTCQASTSRKKPHQRASEVAGTCRDGGPQRWHISIHQLLP